MEDWWRGYFELLIQSGLNKKDVKKAVEHQLMKEREGMELFLKKLAKENIPLIIVSASGLGEEAIGKFLEKRGWLFDNVKIVSNGFVWDESGRAIGIKEQIVHSANKNGTALKDLPELSGKENFLVLGDGADDLAVTEGLSCKEVLSVLFFNKVKNNLEAYRSAADVVISGDGTLSYVNEVLEKIF